MKYRSEFEHGFTTCRRLYCTSLKSLHGFKEKTAHNTHAIFSFKMFKVRFSRFWKCLKTTWNSLEQPAKLTQKEATETKTSHL